MAQLWFLVWTAPVGGHRVSLTQGDSEVREGCGQRLEMKEGGPWGGCWLGEQPLWRGMNRVPSMTVGFQWERGLSSVQFSSVAQSCPTLCDPMNSSTPSLPVHHQLPEFTQTPVLRVGDAIQASHPLSSPFPPAPNPPSTRVFSNESTLHMRWPKYWSFSFNISPSMNAQD